MDGSSEVGTIFVGFVLFVCFLSFCQFFWGWNPSFSKKKWNIIVGCVFLVEVVSLRFMFEYVHTVICKTIYKHGNMQICM